MIVAGTVCGLAKIGFYSPKVKLARSMQTAQSIPVRYGPTSELTGESELHRRFVEDVEEDESLPKGKTVLAPTASVV